MAESGLTNRGSLRQKDPSCVLPSVITELLKDQNLLPRTTPGAGRYRTCLLRSGTDRRGTAGNRAPGRGRLVELILGKMKPKRVFANAAAKGASRVFLIGPDDLAAGKASVKNLATGEQKDWRLHSK